MGDQTRTATDEKSATRAAGRSVVEAMLFASPRPVPLERLAEAAGLSLAEVEAAVDELEKACAAEERGIRLERVAGGVRLVSHPDHDGPIRQLLGMDSRTKLSMAALETLAIIAYRQPVTAPEITDLRGVNSASPIRTLLDRRLITTAGRRPVVGTPFLYRTTKEFLVHFGLGNLSELPKPEELESLYGVEATDPAQADLFSPSPAAAEPPTTATPEPLTEHDRDDDAETNDSEKDG